MNEKRSSFEAFKSNICHRVKDIGDRRFIAETLKEGLIIQYFNKNWFAESLYLLAMVDYLSRINDIPLCTNYEKLRKCKLDSVVYPTSILLDSRMNNDRSILEKSIHDSIPEFMRFNIVESEIRNVV